MNNDINDKIILIVAPEQISIFDVLIFKQSFVNNDMQIEADTHNNVIINENIHATLLILSVYRDIEN